MEMWLTCSTLVFLTAAMVISGQHVVTLGNENEPRSVEVPFGSPLNFSCKITTTEYEKFRIALYFNASGTSSNESRRLTEKEFNISAKKSTVMMGDGQHPGENLWHVPSAADNSSGWYFCKITADIPMLKTIISNGTKVVITKRREHTTHPSLPIVTSKQATTSNNDPQVMDWWLWIAVGVAGFILIILFVICAFLRRSHTSRAEDPIYINAHSVAKKQPSPRPGTDNLKAASSSQNLQNPSPGRHYDDGKRRYK
uniref:uncharacterized protein LOC124060244 isoform X2 n=1 Tax=Scatophagus argus TaxID=75038 RepID=UPI001ED83EA1|nr:uncharacterized protein LOC124060244 isoform X2 [Scatophagus argus]